MDTQPALTPEGMDVLELLEMQTETSFLTKSELLDYVRKQGVSISDRQLITYGSEGLIPRSVRIGSRAGAYPTIVGDLLVWIGRMRKQGLSVEAIKELLPAWKFMQRAWKAKELDLAELEYVVRSHVHSTEAAYAVPALLPTSMPCVNCIATMKFILKDGSVADHREATPLTVKFQMYEVDEGTHEPRELHMVSVPLPAVPTSKNDPTTIAVGLPLGMPVPVEEIASCEIEGSSPELQEHQHER